MPTVATAVLLVATVAASAVLQDGFFTPYGLTSNFAAVLPVAIVTVGQVIVVLGGGIDLSIGTIVTLSSVVTVQLVAGQPDRLPLALGAGLLVGVGCGLVNGLAVAVVRLQPIVATFASSFVFAGLALLILPTPGGEVPSLVTLGYRQVIARAIPVPAVLLLLLWLAWRAVLAHRFGRHVYAVGGNEGAAYASAVPVTAVRLLSYVAGGTFAALAGFALLANSGSGDPFLGNSLTLTSIAALVIGGTRLSGGAGGAGGAIVGAVVLVLIQSLVFFARVPTTARELVTGAIIIVAIALAGLLTARGRGAGP
ncbi:MAG: ABC transporter permease [Streptosporangiales bacterium]|nr:ABC transporter permease [Streptosporangiales bacterium]